MYLMELFMLIIWKTSIIINLFHPFIALGFVIISLSFQMIIIMMMIMVKIIVKMVVEGMPYIY